MSKTPVSPNSAGNVYQLPWCTQKTTVVWSDANFFVRQVEKTTVVWSDARELKHPYAGPQDVAQIDDAFAQLIGRPLIAFAECAFR